MTFGPRLQFLLWMLVIFGAIAGLSSTLTKLIATTSELAINQSRLIDRDNDLLELIDTDLDLVTRTLNILEVQQQQLDILAATVEELDPTNVELSDGESGASQVDALTGRLDAIESAITSNPEQALTIPMIRVNIDSLASDLNNVHDSVNAELNQTHSDIQTIWVSLFTFLSVLTVALIAAVVAFFPRPRSTQGAEHGSR